ncbi:MAG: hypothetical protein ACKOWC_01415 [Limnohabitans sp.]
MTFELLQPFCANESDTREYLRAPFKAGEWVYATNGHMAVRFPAEKFPDIAEVADPEAKAPKVIGGLFSRALEKAGDAFMVMPKMAKLTPCLYCDGKGRVLAVKCGECEDGVFHHGSNWYECKNCEDEAPGPGWIEIDEADPGAVNRMCHFCDGLGFECGSGKRNPPVQLGNAYYNAAYLRLFSKMPQVRIHPGEPAIEKNPLPATFLFDGGHGLLMPYRNTQSA